MSMPDLSQAIVLPGASDWTYDPVRDRIYYVRNDGIVAAFDMATRALQPLTAIYGSPSSIDISPDGRFVIVGNREQTLTSGPFDFQKTYVDVVTQLDLSTGAYRYLTFSPGFYEGGVGDVAVDASGAALLTTYFLGSGFTPLHAMTSAGAFSNLTVGRLGQLPASSGESSYIIMSEDRRYAFVQEANISDGAMHVYDTATGRELGSRSLYDIGSDGFQRGGGDISSAAGLVCDVIGSRVYLFDLTMKPLANLSLYSDGAPVIGAEFNDGGHQLFLLRNPGGSGFPGTGTREVLVLDTTSWMPVGSIKLGGLPGGRMDVVSGGRMLLVGDNASLQAVDLSARLQINLTGDASSQKLWGAIGMDTISGGAGDDTITGFAGQSYLRGDDGNDSIVGGGDFDDINGNVGNDTVSTGAGEDYCVGGKDNDSLAGGADYDLVYGNLGADTCDGGEGNDIVRGGQDNDVVLGGNGDDFVSGDKGDDTMTGGAGADIFHTFGDAGLDRVTDFSLAQGDRVQLDPGTQYTVAQVGADTVITMTGGGQMILVGVQMSTLTPGWIFGA